MKRPRIKTTEATEEIIKTADAVQEEPGMWRGHELKYRWIIQPEQDGELFLLRWYETGPLKRRERMCETYFTWIDVKKEDWTTCDCIEGKWKSARIENLISGQDMDRILLLDGWVPEKFTARGCRGNIPRHINAWQAGIRDRKLEQRQRKKDEHTARLMGQAKKLPSSYYDWQEKTVMKNSRYLIYKRSRKKESEVFCTHCRERQMVLTQILKNKKSGKCPQCGSRIIMKSSGRIRHLQDASWTEYIQAIRDGIMIRCIYMVKDYKEYGRPERTISEPCRIVIERGKNAVWYEIREDQTKFASSEEYKKNPGEGWVTTRGPMMYGRQAATYKKTLWRELEKGFPYHMFRAYAQRHKKEMKSTFHRNLVYDYFDAYSVFPLMESLEKTGKTHLVDYLAGGERSRFCRFDKKAVTVSGMIGINKKQYREHENPTEEDVERLQFLNHEGIHLTAMQYRIFKQYTTSYGWKETTQKVLRHTTMHQFLKYAATVKETELRCWYLDYLRMADRAGYDLNDRFNLFPRNIRQAHEAVRDLLEQEKWEEDLKAADQEHTGIPRIEKKIRQKFSYSGGRYCIRPAKTNREIVREGQQLHICVGNGSYARRMEQGSAYILFLRKKEDPDTPFYTVEITPEFDVIQRHGKYNKEGSEVTEIDNFLKEFVEVKGNGKKYHAAG
ncbi:MAG: hypothetical protein HFG34_00430 [Eubacterium sp.]|nr:hypothetical protein [Eubacterium sp.]